MNERNENGTPQVSSAEQTERALVGAVASGQALRVRVDAADERFHPAQWTSPAVSGYCPAAAFTALERRMPPLLGLRPPGELLDKRWGLTSSTEALGLEVV